MRWRNGKIVGLLTPFVILIAGCQIAGPDAPGRVGGLLIETDGQHYEVGEAISATIRNTGQPVFVNHCCGRPFIGLDRLEAPDEWKEEYPPAGFCIALCDGRPMMLESDFVYQARIMVQKAGIYRLRIVFGEDASFESGNKFVISRAFQVSTE